MKKKQNNTELTGLEHPNVTAFLKVIGKDAHDMLELEDAKSGAAKLSEPELRECLEKVLSEHARLNLFEIALDKTPCELVDVAIQEVLGTEKEIGYRRALLGTLLKTEGKRVSGKRAKDFFVALQKSFSIEKDTTMQKFYLALLQNWKQHFDSKEALAFLEEVATTQPPPVRSFALVLMGVFGGLDILERLYLLSSNDPRDIKAVNAVTESLRKKPIDISLLTPEGFEYLTTALFRKKGYLDVKKTRLHKDGGIDITAISPNDGAVCFIQCKRYKPDHLVREKDVRALDTSVFSRHLKDTKLCAIFVTTATEQAADAMEYLEKRGQSWPFEYIGGVELQKDLDLFFGERKFFLRGEPSALQRANLDLFE